MRPEPSTATPEAYGTRGPLLNLAVARRTPVPTAPGTNRLGVAPPAPSAASHAAPLRALAAAAATLLVLASPAAAGPVVIAALGDSLTQGYGVPEAEGFVPRLQAWLRDNGAPDATIVNAGVSGDTTAGGLARVDWTLTPDIDAVIVELGANDLLRGVDPAETRANLEGILAAIGKRDLPVLLVGVPGIGNFGVEHRLAFDAIYTDLSAAHDTLLYPNFFAGIGDLADPGAARPLMQPDMIHPNAAGVAAIVADIGPSVLDLVLTAQ
ncbi:arylesterase [Amaricoccus sp.]|uniref:arylesterase n=1 Tax=Amaricoccus sp. TaxID=1872485 RepID=UPI001B4199A3|nr:arylesterase [Amaricoccus sp.]MBP7003417.1 arylesterase [Amaricoccus sp.]